MTTFLGMDVSNARQLARSLLAAATQFEATARDLDALVSRSPWRGSDADTFRHAWSGRHRAGLFDSATRVREAGDRLSLQADEQERASDGSGGSCGAGLGAGIGVTPGASLLMVPIGPAINPVLRYLTGLFTPGTRADGDATREGSRASDDAARRHDERFPGRSFDNDWAGRLILANYLAGGPDLNVDNDPKWSSYMMSIDMLRDGGADGGKQYDGMQARNDRQAQAALQQFLTTGQRSGAFDDTFSMAIPNGESITGVNYLHGTNADVGGFQHQGTTMVEPLPDGTYRVSMDVDYRWNDRIDPNNQYSSDVLKNSWAEVLTLGRADAYDIHIGWSSPTTVVVDAQGHVVRREGGWPA